MIITEEQVQHFNHDGQTELDWELERLLAEECFIEGTADEPTLRRLWFIKDGRSTMYEGYTWVFEETDDETPILVGFEMIEADKATPIPLRQKHRSS